MIKHIVLLKIKPNILEKTVIQCLEAVVGLKEKIRGIEDIDFGKNNSHEDKNQGYTHGFTVYFKDEAARYFYLTHPAHQKVVKEHIEPIASDVLVFDY